MQPLNTSVSPSSLSTIDWAPRAERSMIDSRRWPNATGPCAIMPSASGPRDVIAPVIRATAPTSAACPSQRISPQIPHMSPASVYVESAVLPSPVLGAARIQVSLLPPPYDELTIRDPRLATRVNAAGMTCADGDPPVP